MAEKTKIPECPFEPCGWKVVIVPDESRKPTIILPDGQEFKYEPYAKVVAVGPGIYQNGELVPVKNCKVGDTVILDPRASFVPIHKGNIKFRIVDEHFIIGVCNKEEKS